MQHIQSSGAGGTSFISEAAGRFSSISTSGEALYTKEGVFKNFEEILKSLELKQHIAELGCGMNSFFGKGRSLAEFTAMCVALWKLALEKSLPNDAENFFAEFMATSRILGKGKKRTRMTELVNAYNKLFEARKTDNFSVISMHIADTLANADADRKTLQLRISLTIRKFYQLIFDHLI